MTKTRFSSTSACLICHLIITKLNTKSSFWVLKTTLTFYFVPFLFTFFQTGLVIIFCSCCFVNSTICLESENSSWFSYFKDCWVKMCSSWWLLWLANKQAVLQTKSIAISQDVNFGNLNMIDSSKKKMKKKSKPKYYLFKWTQKDWFSKRSDHCWKIQSWLKRWSTCLFIGSMTQDGFADHDLSRIKLKHWFCCDFLDSDSFWNNLQHLKRSKSLTNLDSKQLNGKLMNQVH